MKTWLKYGLIFVGVYLILAIISSLMLFLFWSNMNATGAFGIFIMAIIRITSFIGAVHVLGLFISFMFGFISICLPFTGSCPSVSMSGIILGLAIAVLINSVIYFGLGAFVGFIKSKQNVVINQ